MKFLIAILLFAPLPASVQKSGEIELDQIAGRQKGTRLALRWSVSGCEAGAASPGARMAWRKTSEESCRRFRGHLSANTASLEKTQLGEGAAVPVMGHAPVGLLKLDKLRWRVNLQTGSLCDENGKNCTRPARSPGTELGLLVREIVLEAHGVNGAPPPEWTAADDAAADANDK